MIYLDFILIIVLLICLITDIKSRKIYNKILLPSLIAALLLNIFNFGLNGLVDSVLGLLLGFGILLIPYLMGGMGAGDVKLLSVIGAFKGPMFVFTTAIYMALVGGLIGIIIALYKSGFLRKLKNWRLALSSMKYGLSMFVPSKDSMKKTFPYGVAIVAGAFLSFLLDGVVI